MLKGIDVNQRIEYVSKKDTDEEKTVFVFKPLSGMDMLDMQSVMTEMNSNSVTKFLKSSIAEIKNYTTDNVEDALKTLPADILAELVEEAVKVNNLTDEDKKKS